MAWELLASRQPFLREGQALQFQGGWPASGKDLNGKWYQVDLAQQIKFDVNRIIPNQSSIDFDFSVPAGGGYNENYLSLLPSALDHVYEILLGLRGQVLVYPIYNNSYFQRLEATNLVPTPTDNRGRYLGFYDEQDSEVAEPKLRDYTVKDQQQPVLRVYNDMFTDEPVVMRFIVNRMKVHEIPPPSPEIQRVARIAKYHDLYTY